MKYIRLGLSAFVSYNCAEVTNIECLYAWLRSHRECQFSVRLSPVKNGLELDIHNLHITESERLMNCTEEHLYSNDQVIETVHRYTFFGIDFDTLYEEEVEHVSSDRRRL